MANTAQQKSTHTGARKAVVETYFEGFRRSDHDRILACLTDDVVWDLAGHAHLAVKDAFGGDDRERAVRELP